MTGFDVGVAHAAVPVLACGSLIDRSDHIDQGRISDTLLLEGGSIKAATPVVVDGIVVAASVEGGLQGLEADSGNVVWTRPEIKGVTGLAKDNGIVYAARSSFGLSAIDPKDGRVLWSRRFSAGVLQDPIVHDDVLLLSDSEYGLFIASALNGELLQKIDQREGFFARPSVKSGYLLIIGNYGVLYALSIL